MSSFEWPSDYKMSVCLTWDVDGESAQYVRYPERAKNQLSELTQRLYGPDIGIWKILDMVQRYDVPATFYIPGYTARLHPEVVKAINEAKYPIGLHGYLHETIDNLSPSSEEEVMKKSISALKKAAGYSPSIYRSPSFELNRWTSEILVKYGVQSDSSLMNEEVPYAIETEKGPLIEIPVQWIMDDAEYWMHSKANREKPIADPDSVFRIWKGEFDGYYKSGGCFVLTLHPFISGRWVYLEVIERLIKYIKGFPKVWWTTTKDITEHSMRLLKDGKLRTVSMPSPEPINFKD